jgi:hypothetical protein
MLMGPKINADDVTLLHGLFTVYPAEEKNIYTVIHTYNSI